jgi:hypothetical protein
VRLLWKVLAPRHPRGWLDVHAVWEDAAKTLWIHCHGMERWGLPNVEIVGVPVELSGYVHGLLMHVTGYMKSQKPIWADENLGGKFVSDDQLVIQTATARRSPDAHGAHSGMLRIVDLGEPVESGLPRRLLASYLIATADASKSDEKKIELLRQAVRVFPGDANDPSIEPEGRGPANPNDYFGWENLGTLLCETGKVTEGIRCLEEAVARWPSGARGFSKHVYELHAMGEVPPPEKSPATKFWLTLNVDSVCQKVLARKPFSVSPL